MFCFSSFGVSRRRPIPACCLREVQDDVQGRQPHNPLMAPLYPRLPWLLKRKDCLHRANICGASHRFDQRPHLWKRNVGAVGPPLLRHPPARSFAASAHGSSPDGHDLTEKLWSVYHKTKKQTEGVYNTRLCLLHYYYYYYHKTHI